MTDKSATDPTPTLMTALATRLHRAAPPAARRILETGTAEYSARMARFQGGSAQKTA